MINVIEVYIEKEQNNDLYKTIVSLFWDISKHLNIDFAPFIPLVMDQINKID